MFNEVDPKKALAAVLKHSFADKLDPKHYRTIVPSSGDRGDRNDRSSRGGSHSRDIFVEDGSGQTRLFIAMGRKDNLTPRSLVEMIEKQTKINQRLIDGVTVCGEFSFVNVPFKEAEIILSTLKCPEGRIRNLVQKATGKKSSDSGDSKSRGGSGGRSRGGRSDRDNRESKPKKNESSRAASYKSKKKQTAKIEAKPKKGGNRQERRKALQWDKK